MAMAIRVSDCSFSVSYPQAGEILRVPELTVNTGDQCVLFGPSGSGKTTLFNILAGLLSPTSGVVEVAGNRLDQLSEAERDRFRGKHIGFVFQAFNLLQGLTALENVLIGMTLSGAGADTAKAESLLLEVGLQERLHHFPFQLSIGEQQRVAIARALAHRPALILADEPTGSLDPKNAGEVMEMILRLSAREQCTLLVISHDPAMVPKFARQIPMETLNRAFAGRFVKGPTS